MNPFNPVDPMCLVRQEEQSPYTFRLPIGQPVSNIDHVSQPLLWFPVFVAGSLQRIEH